MSFLAWMIYVGGACAMPKRKIGFWRRVWWPIELGEVLLALVLAQKISAERKEGGE